jgi:hypothetical protein
VQQALAAGARDAVVEFQASGPAGVFLPDGPVFRQERPDRDWLGL